MRSDRVASAQHGVGADGEKADAHERAQAANGELVCVDAHVVTLFLFPEINARLAPKLRRELRPGARVVSHRFGLGDWPPELRIEAHGHPLLRWTIPAR